MRIRGRGVTYYGQSEGKVGTKSVQLPLPDPPTPPSPEAKRTLTPAVPRAAYALHSLLEYQGTFQRSQCYPWQEHLLNDVLGEGVFILTIRGGDNISVTPGIEYCARSVQETVHAILRGIANRQEVELSVRRNAKSVLDIELLSGQ